MFKYNAIIIVTKIQLICLPYMFKLVRAHKVICPAHNDFHQRGNVPSESLIIRPGEVKISSLTSEKGNNLLCIDGM